ncbi:MAG: ribonuclease III [Bacteroidaceae bacterium]|nr:ribonuclease III [Bacteroidaceae bacterium]
MFLKANIIDRIKLPLRKDRELYAAFYDILGFYPRHIRYYKQALMHKSVTNGRSHKDSGEHNERLEFLGDAILEAITSDLLYHRFTNKREGFLTDTRSKLVKRETLNQLAREMGLDRLIHSDGRSTAHNSYMGGNAFEALVGAIYLDRGYEACMYFMRKRILGQMVNLDKVANKEVNFKSKLIEWAQKRHVNVEFRVTEEQREKNNSPVFITRIILEGLECETGKGYSKKESHQNAACATLKEISGSPEFVRAILEARARRVALEQQEQEDALVTKVPQEVEETLESE